MEPAEPIAAESEAKIFELLKSMFETGGPKNDSEFLLQLLSISADAVAAEKTEKAAMRKQFLGRIQMTYPGLFTPEQAETLADVAYNSETGKYEFNRPEVDRVVNVFQKAKRDREAALVNNISLLVGFAVAAFVYYVR
jgi:hypothetical protein